MVAAHALPVGPPRGESRFLLHDVPWWTYVALRDAQADTAIRMTYLRGALELMSPSELHEESKKIIARLVEVWAEELDVDLRGFGSATLGKEAEQRGLEPDKCYMLGKKERDAVPHVAIEVVVTSPLLDKLEVYAGLGVPEVWIWSEASRTLPVHRLTGRAYEVRPRSVVVPGLDLAHLATFVRPGESHTELARTYRASLAATR